MPSRFRIPVLAPLAHRNYRLLFASLVLAIFAIGAWSIYLVLEALHQGASAAALSSVVAWTGLGLLVMSLAGGVVADRLAKRTVLAGILTIDTLAATIIMVLSATGTVQLWHLGIAAFVIGSSTAFFFPAYTALVPHIVPSHDLMAVNGLEGATRPTVQQAIAPALIGVVIGAAVPAVGAAVVAAAFGLALLCSVGLPADEVERSEERANVLTDLAGGFRYAVRTPWVLASVLFAAVMGLVVGGPIEVLLPTMIRAEHSNAAQVYGLLVAALGVGGFVGSMVAGSITMPRRYLSTMLGSWGLGCLPLALIALTSHLWVIGAALFFYGALIGVGMVIWGTLLQQRVPLEMLGRIASLDFLVSISLMPISIALAGMLSTVLPYGIMFALAGLTPPILAVVLIAAARLRRDELAHPLQQAEHVTAEHAD